MKIIYLNLFLCILVLPIYGQVTFQPKSIDFDWKGVVYNTEKTLDIRIHANGGAVAYNTGQILTYEKTKYYHFEVGWHSDPRERAQARPYNLSLVRGGGSFTYGKINNFYVARAGMGRKTYLTEKAKRKGIAVGYNYEFGPSIGFLKPYYLRVYTDQNDFVGLRTTELKYSEETAEDFLDIRSIASKANFSEGLLETKIIPGIQGKLGVHFDTGAYDEFVKAAEIGVMMDIFTRSIPLMAPTDNHPYKPFFFNLYVNLQLGKRE